MDAVTSQSKRHYQHSLPTIKGLRDCIGRTPSIYNTRLNL